MIFRPPPFLRNILSRRRETPPHAAPAALTDAAALTAAPRSDVVMRVDQNFLPTYVSPSVLDTLGWTPDEILGRAPNELVVGEDFPAFAAAGKRALSGTEDARTETFRMLRKDGSTIWVEGRSPNHLTPVAGEPGVIVMHDITARKELEKRLEAMAMTDDLTGLANRRAFDGVLAREWQRTLRERTQLSLLMLDLDIFKGLNDRYGHQAGDDCLRAVAGEITKAVHRPGDLAARYGGEEIAVILGNTDAAGALEVAERIRAAVSGLGLPNPANAQGHGRVTISIGAATAICRAGNAMEMPAALVTAADAALYAAKEQGRNRVVAAALLDE
jgi:diguanylate cyclase (GGDEF)-like protein/PAS domain S-box-containing protein